MTRTPKNTDGTGKPIVDDDEYYVQDTRTRVGNCGSWWAQKRSGYVCNLNEAGRYTGVDVRSMRETDVPWPVAYVEDRAILHVRVDTDDFHRHDDAYQHTPDPSRFVASECLACGFRHAIDGFPNGQEVKVIAVTADKPQCRLGMRGRISNGVAGAPYGDQLLYSVRIDVGHDAVWAKRATNGPYLFALFYPCELEEV